MGDRVLCDLLLTDVHYAIRQCRRGDAGRALDALERILAALQPDDDGVDLAALQAEAEREAR